MRRAMSERTARIIFVAVTALILINVGVYFLANIG
jgi:hypothetical protein